MSTISRRRFLEDSMFDRCGRRGGSGGRGLRAPRSRFWPRWAPMRRSASAWLGSAVADGEATARNGSLIRVRRFATSAIPTQPRRRSATRSPRSRAASGPSSSPTCERLSTTRRSTWSSNASSNHWHALCGVWAMQAKKHCYLEKPICHNVHEGRALVAAAKKYGMCCQVGTQCRSNASNINAVKFIHEGGIGEVKFARGLCYRRRKSIGPLGKYEVPETVNYDLWSGPAPIPPTHATQVPLRLALAAGVRQRRSGQPGTASDGYRPLASGNRSISQLGDHLGRSARIRRREQGTGFRRRRRIRAISRRPSTITATSASYSRPTASIRPTFSVPRSA